MGGVAKLSISAGKNLNEDGTVTVGPYIISFKGNSYSNITLASVFKVKRERDNGRFLQLEMLILDKFIVFLVLNIANCGVIIKIE